MTRVWTYHNIDIILLHDHGNVLSFIVCRAGIDAIDVPRCYCESRFLSAGRVQVPSANIMSVSRSLLRNMTSIHR